MKKIIINENWEEEIIEDTSSFFVIIFKQGTNSGYIKAYSTSNEEILATYNELITAYESTGFNLPTKLYIVKLPATGQVKVMLEQALYNGEENNATQIEIINHLLGRADCEYIGESNIGMLTEAKKKKKKKKRKTPRVTYTTGWPWYNDHMFNHHMGSCDCNKDNDEAGEDAADNANDAIGGGESVGDASSSEGLGSGDFGGGDAGGAMGESLNEAMTPLEKMQALEAGTRGFNAAAAGWAKLQLNRDICIKNKLFKALKIIEDAMIDKGYLTRANSVTYGPKTITPPTYKHVFDIQITANEIQPADVYFVLDNKNDVDIITDGATEATAKQTFHNLFLYLGIALYLKELDIMNKIKEFILANYDIKAAELKQLLLNKLVNDKAIHDRILSCIETAIEERK